MAQLSDDCFAFGGPLLSIEAARALLAERVACVAGTETVALWGALGRVLAEDLRAPIDVPARDNSAVDGYAIRFDDLDPAADTVLPVEGRVAAGREAVAPEGRVAVRIFTGAPMPAGFDTVMMQEDAALDGDRVILRTGLKRGANARKAGEDVALGSVALPAGRRLRPPEIGLAASLGLTTLEVRRPLRVAVLSTGDELVEPGAPLSAAGIYDSNRFTVAALLARLGCAVIDHGIVRDCPKATGRALSQAAEAADLIVSTGGVSTGEEDHVKAALDAAGRLHFWRLAIKPGRPVAMGQILRVDGATVPFVGLPGNPVATMVTFLHLVRPLIDLLQGAENWRPVALPVRAAFGYKKKRDRREYVRVTLTMREDGQPEAVKFPRDGAGVLSSMAAADGLIELREDVTQVAPGDLVPYLPMPVLMP